MAAMADLSNSTRPQMFFEERGCTELEVVNYSYTWTITYFSYCTEETGEFLESPKFSIGANEEMTWCLRIYPNGDETDNKEYISLYLILKAFDKPKARASSKFSILNDKKEKVHSMGNMDDSYTIIHGSGRGCHKFVKRDFLLNKANKLLPNDELTVLCEGKVCTRIFKISGPSNSGQYEIPKSRLIQDLQVSFLNPKFSDVTLIASGVEFKAHKTILAARSPVFSVMFDNEMKEQKENIVNITDANHEVVRELLRFMYTDRAQNLEEIAADLLTIADKYGLQRLKVICEAELVKSLAVENAADTLKVADLHGSIHLKEKAINFISMHAAEVMNTEDYKSMVKSHSHLVDEILRVFMRRVTGDADNDALVQEETKK